MTRGCLTANQLLVLSVNVKAENNQSYVDQSGLLATLAVKFCACFLGLWNVRNICSVITWSSVSDDSSHCMHFGEKDNPDRRIFHLGRTADVTRCGTMLVAAVPTACASGALPSHESCTAERMPGNRKSRRAGCGDF